MRKCLRAKKAGPGRIEKEVTKENDGLNDAEKIKRRFAPYINPYETKLNTIQVYSSLHPGVRQNLFLFLAKR